ncbi:hypothetical protein [Mycolicibacterium peregrinum]|uniref:hypothetical protein n=1 Tax=Mycolicibacterium peregrinum TaxID=43304 RepID=UPI0013F4F5FA|nr:hypothetical protein [Mycolicibacterium peregrinum]
MPSRVAQKVDIRMGSAQSMVTPDQRLAIVSPGVLGIAALEQIFAGDDRHPPTVGDMHAIGAVFVRKAHVRESVPRRHSMEFRFDV